MNSKRKKSLASYLTWRIAIVTTLIFVLSGVATHTYVNQKMETYMRTEVALKAKAAATNVQNIIENAKIHTGQMALNPTLIQYLKNVKSRDQITKDPLYSQTIQYLNEVEGSSKTHFAAWVANEEANFYFDSNGIMSDESYDVHKRPWYDVAMGSKTVEFTPPYVDWGSGRIVFSSIKALREPNDKVYGFVVIDVMLEMLPGIMNDARLTEKDENFLITAEGNYVYHKQQDQIVKGSIKDVDSPLKQYASQILSEREGFIEIEYKGRPMFLAYYPASESGWIILLLIDKGVLSQEANQVAWILFVIFALGLAILTFVAVKLIQGKLKPLTTLSQIANDISEGNLNTKIEDAYLKMDDEIGEMGNSFLRIADTLIRENDALEMNLQEKNLELAVQYRYILETEKMAALGNLVAGVTHEINNPLGVGMTAASYLQSIGQKNKEKFVEGTLTKGDLRTFMEEIEESTELLAVNLNRAAELIKGFKQVAVDQSNEGRISFNLKENIDVVALSLRHEYKRQKHEVICDCSNTIMLESYPGLYSQIFSNLMMNSIHHGFKNKEHGTMRFACEIEGDSLKIIYTDNGIGIPPENMERIFEPFFTTNRSKGNNGLGMHIVQTLIEQKLNGKIECYSQWGEGVKFVMTLPLHI